MYDKFTDDARNAMQLANRAAMRFGSQFIKTEHVLLGLIGVDRAVAITVLKNLEVDVSWRRHQYG